MGKDRVLSETEELLCYSYDATSKDFMPDVVVFPLNAEEISKIVKLCLKYNTPVVGRGSGSGFSGGSLPLKGGVVVSFTKMNRILELDEENMFVTVEPGIINADLKTYLSEKSFKFIYKFFIHNAINILPPLMRRLRAFRFYRLGNFSESNRPVRYCVFFLRAYLRRRFIKLRHDKNGVVAETFRSAYFIGN